MEHTREKNRLRPFRTAKYLLLGVLLCAVVGTVCWFAGRGGVEETTELDAVVLDDSRLTAPRPLTVAQRLERAVYLSEDRDVVRKFVQGREVSLPS